MHLDASDDDDDDDDDDDGDNEWFFVKWMTGKSGFPSRIVATYSDRETDLNWHKSSGLAE